MYGEDQQDDPTAYQSGGTRMFTDDEPHQVRTKNGFEEADEGDFVGRKVTRGRG